MKLANNSKLIEIGKSLLCETNKKKISLLEII